MQTRRLFLKSSFIGTAFLATACAENTNTDDTSPLQILKVVQIDLFPQDAIENANAYAYLSVVLKHSLITQEDKKYLRNGTRWLNEEALLQYDIAYIKLNAKEKQNILKIISKESWGRSWIKTVLTYIMEASLGDPIYGINKKESGWKWLSHVPGYPRPKEALL